jgi:hypothetical protein
MIYIIPIAFLILYLFDKRIELKSVRNFLILISLILFGFFFVNLSDKESMLWFLFIAISVILIIYILWKIMTILEKKVFISIMEKNIKKIKINSYVNYKYKNLLKILFIEIKFKK